MRALTRVATLAAAAWAAGCADPVEPVVPGLISAVTAGENHSCAIDVGGQAFCWGDARFGQLGAVNLSCRGDACRTPVPVQGGFRWTDLALGERHTCGIAGRTAFCWGLERFGQLGSDSLAPQPCQEAPGFRCARIPERAAIGLPLSAVAAYGSHSCALDPEGRAFCWGRNLGMQLGTGDSEDRLAPTPVDTDLRFTVLETGEAHSCGLTADGVIYCWGYGASGRLGVGDTRSRSAPTRVGGAVVTVGWTALAVGHAHACAIDVAGIVRCWGLGNQGQLGRGDRISRILPLPVNLPEPATAVAAGGAHTCALSVSQSLYCWGLNEDGQLGIGEGVRRLTPVEVPLAPVESVSAGRAHTCAVATDGQLYCWGGNDYGQVGDGTEARRRTPVPVAF